MTNQDYPKGHKEIIEKIFQKWVGETERNCAWLPEHLEQRKKPDKLFIELLKEALSLQDKKYDRLLAENNAIKERHETLYNHHEGSKLRKQISDLKSEKDSIIALIKELIKGTITIEDIKEKLRLGNKE